MSPHFDEAVEFLIERLAAMLEALRRAGEIARNNSYVCDLWISAGRTDLLAR
jgi:hypothetical protein